MNKLSLFWFSKYFVVPKPFQEYIIVLFPSCFFYLTYCVVPGSGVLSVFAYLRPCPAGEGLYTPKARPHPP